MEKKVFDIINEIRALNDMNTVAELTAEQDFAKILAFTHLILQN